MEEIIAIDEVLVVGERTASVEENQVLNLHNHKNVYDYSECKDYSHRIATYQFPLLLSLGVKVNF